MWEKNDLLNLAHWPSNNGHFFSVRMTYIRGT